MTPGSCAALATSCNVYLTPFLNRIRNYQRFSSADYVEGVKGEFCKVLRSGYVELEDGSGTKHILHDVLYAPESQRSLLSVAKLMEHHKFEIEFVERFNPRKYHLVSVKSGLKLPRRTINDLFYIWEPKSMQMALITTRSMAKHNLHDGNEGRQDMAMSEGENFSPKSPDPQPIGRREIENSQPQSFDVRPIEIEKHDPALSFTEIHPMKIQPIETSTHRHHQPLSSNNPSGSSASNPTQIDTSIDDFHLWYRRLGHTSLRALRKLGFIAADRQTSPCEACSFAKQT